MTADFIDKARALAIAAVLAAFAAGAAQAQVAAQPPAAALSPMPDGVQVRNGDLIDPTGLPLYTFDFDTMVGMSHCVGVCLSAWRPFLAPAGARPMGDWTLIGREDGAVQWAYKAKPLYTYLKDTPGGRATGARQDNWRTAESTPGS